MTVVLLFVHSRRRLGKNGEAMYCLWLRGSLILIV